MKKTSNSQEESGMKWWLRYIIVPIIGGGGVTAIIAALIMRPIPPHATPNSSMLPSPAANTAEATPEPATTGQGDVAKKLNITPTAISQPAAPEAKLQKMAQQYSFQCYVLMQDTSINHFSLSSISDRPLYVLDLTKLNGNPADEEYAIRLYTEYAALQNGESEPSVSKKVSLLQAASQVKRVSLWVKTDLSGNSAVKIYTARPKVKIQVNSEALEYQKEIQMVFLSKDSSTPMLVNAMIAELTKTGNGMLMTNAPIPAGKTILTIVPECDYTKLGH